VRGAKKSKDFVALPGASRIRNSVRVRGPKKSKDFVAKFDFKSSQQTRQLRRLITIAFFAPRHPNRIRIIRLARRFHKT
jgi:hypothetical protein